MARFDSRKKRNALLLAVWSIFSLILIDFGINRLEQAYQQFFGVSKSRLLGVPLWTSEVLIGALLLLIALIVAFYRAIPVAQKAFRTTRAVVLPRTNPQSRKFRAIILTLSPLLETDLPERGGTAAVRATIEWLRNNRSESRIRLLNQLCTIYRPGGEQSEPPVAWIGQTPWQQTLRVLRHHIDRVERIHFVLSKEAAQQFELVRELLSLLASDRVTILPVQSDGSSPEIYIDLADYDAVAKAISGACEDSVKALRRGTENDICVDITSGLKVFSAAATVVTLNSGASFSYVGTRNEGIEGEVVVYRAELIN